MAKRPIAFETLRRAIAGNLVGRIVQIVALLLSSVILARTIGAEGLGIVAIVSSAVRMAVIPAQEGANKLCEREIAGAIGKKNGHQAHAALRFNLLLSSGIFLALAPLVYWFLAQSLTGGSEEQPRHVLLAALSLLGTTIALSTLRGLLRGEGQSTRAAHLSNIVSLSIPGLYVAWIVWADVPLSPAVALWLQVATKLMAIPLAVVLVRRYWVLIPARDQKPSPGVDTGGWILEATQFTLLGIVAIALMEVSTLMLGYLSTPEEVGLFRIASRVFMIVGLVSFAANQAFGPRIAMVWQSGDTAALETPTRMISVLALGVSAILLVLFAIFGRWVLTMLFGPEFQAAYLPALVMSAGAMSASFGSVAGRLLKMSGEQRIVIRGSLAGLLAAISLNYLLIPDYGATGSAIALAAGITIARIIHSRGVRSHMGFLPFPNLVSAKALWLRGKRALL